MALNPTLLGTQMAAAIGVTDALSIAAYTQLATAICAHIIANAVVTVATTDTIPALGLISPGGLSPAPVTGVASGTGTGTGTIS